MVLVVGVLAVTGYLAWRVYQTPRHPDEAGEVATKMTDVTVWPGVATPRCVSRCATSPPRTRSTRRWPGAPSWPVEPLRPTAWAGSGSGISAVTDTDLHRSSGSVTVSGTLITSGPQLPTTFRWPVTFVDGHWYIDGGADVDVG